MIAIVNGNKYKNMTNIFIHYLLKIFLFAIVLAICTSCRKKHAELVSKGAQWVRQKTSDDSIPQQRLV